MNGANDSYSKNKKLDCYEAERMQPIDEDL
jgi:hypothetical protein